MAAFSTALTIGLLAGGTALSAISQIKAGKAEKEAGQAQRRAADSQAALADYNAAVADLQAKDAIARGADEESRFRTRIGLMVGEQRTGFAAGNVDTGYGSAADTQADAALLGELDALTIRTNAAREAWGYSVQGEDLRERARIARREGVMMEEAGNSRASAAKWGAATTIVGAGASLMTNRYGFNRRMKAA